MVFNDLNNISKHKQLFYLANTNIAIIIKNLKQFQFFFNVWLETMKDLVQVTKSRQFCYEVSHIGPC